MQYPTGSDTDIEDFIAQLRQALSHPLPGVAAQLEMAPLGRPRPSDPPDDVRQSAVLALLHEPDEGVVSRDALSLVFTLRPTSLRHHGGQISFPGGGMERQDRSLTETALRETAEELGISAGEVSILGSLTPLYIEPSRNLVHPYVGWLPQLPRLDPDPVEVSAVLDVTLRRLLDPNNLGQHVWHRYGEAFTAPCYLVPAAWEGDDHLHIWGATAMMLNELLAIIRPLVSQPPHRPEAGL